MDHQKTMERAAALAAQMSLEEKAAQLYWTAPEIPRLGIPAHNWWNEALHGVARAGTATVFPQPIGLAATFDDALLGEIAQAIALEVRAKYNAASAHGDRDTYKGLSFWAPNINIFRDPRWGRGHETYGEDPHLTARMGVAFVKGLQGNGEYLHAVAGVKHFVAHSGPEKGRGAFDALVSPKDLEETYLPAFRATVCEGGAAAVMSAYNKLNGVPCAANSFLLQEVLRKSWGFTGIVASDAWAIENMTSQHHLTEDDAQAAALALKNGCDLDIGGNVAQMLEAHRQGLVSEATITKACIRMLALRILLGQMDADCPLNTIPLTENDKPEHHTLALKAALRGITLLKNDGVLPIRRKNVRTILVTGPNADSRTCLEGNYCGTASRYVTFLEGIRAACGDDMRVLYAPGCFLFKDRETFLSFQGDDRLAEARAAAACADLIIACVGLDTSIEGEDGDTSNHYPAGDKENLELPDVQQRLLAAMEASGKPLVTVVASGSALRVATGNAILWSGYPGQMGGEALAMLLFGERSPSGRLPITFYRTAENLPPIMDYSMQGRTYRYLNAEPLYPFGYGLSYTRFTYQDAAFTEGILSVTVHNAGDMSGDEVVQVYVRNESPDAPPHPVLCGFRRVHIPAGERVRVEIPIGDDAFTVVDGMGTRCPCHRATLFVGGNQPDERSAALIGQTCLSVRTR